MLEQALDMLIDVFSCERSQGLVIFFMYIYGEIVQIYFLCLAVLGLVAARGLSLVVVAPPVAEPRL